MCVEQLSPKSVHRNLEMKRCYSVMPGLKAISGFDGRPFRCPHIFRSFATASTKEVSSEAPLLLKMRTDMKEAMKKKDSTRLVIQCGSTSDSYLN